MRVSSSATGRPAFGILPMGTANDFARAGAIPLDLTEALRLVTDLNRTLVAFRQEGLGAFERIVVAARLPWVEVSSANSVNVNLDGEPISGERLDFEIVPGALSMYLPADSPLLRRTD